MVRAVGDTFIFTFDGSHLSMAITSPLGPNGLFLAVNLTSVKDGKPFDDTCLVQPGEHPWVRKTSEVYYQKAREWQVSGFDSLGTYGGSCVLNAPLSAALLLRVQEGALVSPHMKGRFQTMVSKQLGRA